VIEPTAEHRLAADGGWCNAGPPRLKPDVDMTSVVKVSRDFDEGCSHISALFFVLS
jgi:hypothetical protein